MQHYVIKFVSDLRQVGGFLRILRFPPPIKLIEKLKVVLNTITRTLTPKLYKCVFLLLLCFSQNLGSTYYIFRNLVKKTIISFRQHIKSYRLYKLGFMR